LHLSVFVLHLSVSLLPQIFALFEPSTHPLLFIGGGGSPGSGGRELEARGPPLPQNWPWRPPGF
jgi:hypothetical protein